MHDKRAAAPHSTAVRVALWRAMHVQVDPLPHVLEDEISLQLAAPDDGWRRRPEIASRLKVFEVDQPGPQAWRRQRLIELGFAIREWLRLVPVDFEAGGSWWERLNAVGFDASQPAIAATLRQIAVLAQVVGGRLQWRRLLLCEPSLESAMRPARPGKYPDQPPRV